MTAPLLSLILTREVAVSVVEIGLELSLTVGEGFGDGEGVVVGLGEGEGEGDGLISGSGLANKGGGCAAVTFVVAVCDFSGSRL